MGEKGGMGAEMSLLMPLPGATAMGYCSGATARLCHSAYYAVTGYLHCRVSLPREMLKWLQEPPVPTDNKALTYGLNGDQRRLEL